MQKHDIGYQKQQKNAKLNPTALTKYARRINRAASRQASADDLWAKQRRVPRSWEPTGPAYWGWLFRTYDEPTLKDASCLSTDGRVLQRKERGGVLRKKG